MAVWLWPLGWIALIVLIIRLIHDGIQRQKAAHERDEHIAQLRIEATRGMREIPAPKQNPTSKGTSSCDKVEKPN